MASRLAKQAVTLVGAGTQGRRLAYMVNTPTTQYLAESLRLTSAMHEPSGLHVAGQSIS